MEEEHGTFVVDFSRPDPAPNTAAVRLTVTVVLDGDDTISREFAAETTGTARPLRAAYDTCNALRSDAHTWLQSLRPTEKKRTVATPTVRVTPVPVTGWQRFLLALGRLPAPVRHTTLPTEPAGAETGAETSDEAVFHTAAASVSVDSAHMTDTVSVAGNTNGSPYQLAEDLLSTVVTDMRQRLVAKRYDLEDAR